MNSIEIQEELENSPLELLIQEYIPINKVYLIRQIQEEKENLIKYLEDKIEENQKYLKDKHKYCNEEYYCGIVKYLKELFDMFFYFDFDLEDAVAILMLLVCLLFAIVLDVILLPVEIIAGVILLIMKKLGKSD